MLLTPEDVPPPLTPADVRNQEFGTTRFRPGYDQREVDAFLARVEEALVDRDLQLGYALGGQTRWFDPDRACPGEPERQVDRGQVSGPPATAESTMTAASRLLEMAEPVSAGATTPSGNGSALGSIAAAVWADPAPADSPDEPTAQRGPAWHSRPAFMLSFAVAAIMIVISSVGYRLAQGSGPVGATVAAGSQASVLHLADRSGGRPGEAQAVTDLASSGPDPARKPAPGRAHTMDPASATAFGPDGRSQGDDPQDAWLAIDGHRPTAWHTGRYPTACFRAPYPGTGLLLDMGHPVTITAVRVTIGTAAGATFQIRIGDRPTLADLRTVTNSAGPGGIVRMTLSRPVTGRYVLVWFTRLPHDPAGTFQAAVHGIGVKAQS